MLTCTKIVSLLLSVAMTIACISASVQPAQAQSMEVIAGTVTGASGEPLANVNVYFCQVLNGDDLCDFYADAARTEKFTTDSTGQYEAYLTVGTYRVYFRTSDAIHMSEWHHNAVHQSGSTAISVPSGIPGARIDAQLDIPSVISGRVSGATNPLVGGTAEVYVLTPLAEPGDWPGWQRVYQVRIGANGDYSLRVRPGTYRMLFRGCFTKMNYNAALGYLSCGTGGREWHGDQPSPATSVDVVALSGQAATLDAQLDQVRPPAVITRPRVIGKAKVGKVLTVTAGAWDPASATDDGPFYRWYAGRRALTKSYSESSSLRLSRDLVGKKLWAKVTARVWGSAYTTVSTKRTARVQR